MLGVAALCALASIDASSAEELRLRRPVYWQTTCEALDSGVDWRADFRPLPNEIPGFIGGPDDRVFMVGPETLYMRLGRFIVPPWAAVRRISVTPVTASGTAFLLQVTLTDASADVGVIEAPCWQRMEAAIRRYSPTTVIEGPPG